MKSKILLAGILAASFAFAGNAYAVDQNIKSGTGAQIQQQTETANQSEDNQIQTHNQQQSQTDGEAGDQAKNQNQTQNQGETNQIQNQEQEAIQAESGNGLQTKEQRRSGVANAVQEMLQVAERNGGIGQQVKTIAQTQTQNQEKLEASLQKVQNRKGFAKFFIGPDYGEINNAKKILEQNREQIKQLNQIKNQLSGQSDQQSLAEQLQLLEEANLGIENSLNSSQKGFNLLGWVFRFLAK